MPDRVQLSGTDFSFSLVRDERRLTEHVHLAFPRTRTPPSGPSTPPHSRRATRTTAAPGEREVYHPGYYGAFVLDPADGHNVEVVNDND